MRNYMTGKDGSMPATSHTFHTGENALLPATLELGPAALVVRDLARSVEFYTRSLGLELIEQGQGRARVGTGDVHVLELVERPDAAPAGRHAGLFHVALLFPSRLELARVGRRLLDTGTPIQGASDHGTHEAFYLADPDGNGLELAADRPRAEWKAYDMDGVGPRPLDAGDLLALSATEVLPERAADGVRVGHLHIHVGDLDGARAFYVGVVGFEEQFAFATAAFVSAGGYHHHLGMNLWKGAGVPPMPEDVVGLLHWTVELAAPEDVDAVVERAEAAGIDVRRIDSGVELLDPWHIPVRIVAR